ncbi:hypothetical protein FB645_002075 [Coemansia sp. IMI 203386]|nr:hypothetical protein FB645_002075 [Coemansia sp. IMI 203386]
MVGSRILLIFLVFILAVSVVQVAAQEQNQDDALSQSQDVITGASSSEGIAAAASQTILGAGPENSPTGAPVSQGTSAGVSARLSAAKFIAGLFWSSQTTGMHRRCSATIIAENVLVTSAACAQTANPISKYGDGEWRIVAGTDDRYLSVPAASVVGNKVESVSSNKCSNLAIITLSEPLLLGDNIAAILMSNSPVLDTTTVVTYNTIKPEADPLVILTPGDDDACELLFPDYDKRGLLCTSPVDTQDVTADYLGGDAIIGFVPQDDVAKPVLFGVTGLYYSTVAEAQTAQANDVSAYRYNPLVSQHVGRIASLGGLDAQKIATPATPM